MLCVVSRDCHSWPLVGMKKVKVRRSGSAGVGALRLDKESRHDATDATWRLERTNHMTRGSYFLHGVEPNPGPNQGI
jgi:hypothetical protein